MWSPKITVFPAFSVERKMEGEPKEVEGRGGGGMLCRKVIVRISNEQACGVEATSLPRVLAECCYRSFELVLGYTRRDHCPAVSFDSQFLCPSGIGPR